MSAASRARHQQPAGKMATKTQSATRRTAAEGGTREKLGRGAEKKTDTRQNGFELRATARDSRARARRPPVVRRAVCGDPRTSAPRPARRPPVRPSLIL